MADEKKRTHPLQRAWCAGVFEGKCTVKETRNTISMDSWSEQMLLRFAEEAGVGYVSELKGNQWRYITTSLDESRELILFVMPLLSPAKAAQCLMLLRKIENNPNWIKANPEKAKNRVTFDKEGNSIG